MVGIRVLAAVAFGLAIGVMAGAPAHAQATRTWVSGVGDDANPCSRTAPCKTFAGAISKTAAGGEIDTIDNGAYGAVTITKSITIVGMGPGQAGVLASGTNGIIINAGPNDVVRLKGLMIEGAGTGLNGIRFIAGAALHVDNLWVYGFNSNSAPNGNGILFTPTASAELYVANSTFAENGAASTGGGITVQPSGSNVTTTVIIDNVNFLNSPAAGLKLINSGTTGTSPMYVAVKESALSGNAAGGIATATSGSVLDVSVDNSLITANQQGINAGSAPTMVRVSRSTIQGNVTAFQSSGGTIQTLQSNNISGNSVVGPFTSVAPQ